MPVSSKKAKELEVRRRLVGELWVLGLSGRETAEMMCTTESNVTNDRKCLGLVGDDAEDRPQSNEDRLMALLRRYAELTVGGEQDDELRQIIERHPTIRDLRSFIRGAVTHHLAMMNIGARIPEPYAKLLMVVFGDSYKNEISNIDYFIEYFFTSFLNTDFGIRKFTSVRDIHLHITEMVREELGVEDVFVQFSRETVVDGVNKAFKILTPHEEKVIWMRFGFEGESMLLDEVGEAYSLSGEWIRQIEVKALRKLGRFFRVKMIVKGAHTARDVMRREWQLEKRIGELKVELQRLHEQHEQGAHVETPYVEEVDRTIEDHLELSQRAYNCLHNANIRYIGELARKSEFDLLGIRNLGRRSLKEIKESLAEMGLHLGMKLEGWTPPTEPAND